MKAPALSARLDRMPMVKAVAPFAAGILAADCFTLPLWFLAGAFLLSGTLALLLHSLSGALVLLLTAGFAASQLRDTAHTLPAVYTQLTNSRSRVSPPNADATPRPKRRP